MSLNEILSYVIKRNVKNEELGNIIYKFCTEENQSVVETENALVTSRCFSEYKLEESEIIVSIMLDNIDFDMELYSSYLPSVIRNRIGMLEANIHGSIVFQSKKKYAGIAENGLWDLKKRNMMQLGRFTSRIKKPLIVVELAGRDLTTNKGFPFPLKINQI